MIAGYQPRAAVPPLARVPARGPVSRELRALLEKWLRARQHDRELTSDLGACARDLDAARAARREAFADQDEATLDGRPADTEQVKQLERRVDKAERRQAAAVD